jgi:2-oxoglutarate ferredoxin oxidoreductase subunit beta
MDALAYYREEAEVDKEVDTRNVGIDFQGDITMGRFVRREKPTYLEAVNERYANVLGDDYQLYGMTPQEREEKERREAEARAKAQALMEDEEARLMAEDFGVDEEGLG